MSGRPVRFLPENICNGRSPVPWSRAIHAARAGMMSKQDNLLCSRHSRLSVSDRVSVCCRHRAKAMMKHADGSVRPYGQSGFRHVQVHKETKPDPGSAARSIQQRLHGRASVMVAGLCESLVRGISNVIVRVYGVLNPIPIRYIPILSSLTFVRSSRRSENRSGKRRLR